MGLLARSSPALLALAALAGPGCQRSDLRITVPYVDTDHAAVVAVGDGSKLDLYAVDPGDHDPRTLHSSQALNSDQSLTITALFYRRPLPDLGLMPGTITAVEDGSGRPLPVPDEILATQVSLDGAADWAPLEKLPPELDRFRAPRAQACLRFRADAPVDLGVYPERGLVGPVRWDDASAILAMNGSAVFVSEISRFGAEGLTPIDLGLGEFRVTAMTVGDDGRIWIAGGTTSEAQLWMGTNGQPFVQVSRDASIIGQYRLPFSIAVAEGEAADTLYGLAQAGDLYRIDAQGWARIATGTKLSKRIAWAGPELILGSDALDQQIHAYDHGTVRLEPLPIDESILGRADETRGLNRVPGYGVLAGSFHGRVMLRGAEGWRVIAIDPEMNAMNVFDVLAGHLVVGGAYGLFTQVDPDVGLCDPVLLGGTNLWTIAPIENGAIVAGKREIDADNDQLFVQRVELSP